MCMNETFVKQPNLPAGRVTLAAVSGAFPEIPDALEAYGVACIRTEADPRLQPQIAHHADMQIFHLDQNRIFVLKGEQALRKKLEAAGFAVAETAAEPAAKYPGDVLCNALLLGNKLLANLGSVDPLIYSFVETLGLQTIHVNQGYTRCATAVVNDHAIITMDDGIYAAAQFMGRMHCTSPSTRFFWTATTTDSSAGAAVWLTAMYWLSQALWIRCTARIPSVHFSKSTVLRCWSLRRTA